MIRQCPQCSFPLERFRGLIGPPLWKCNNPACAWHGQKLPDRLVQTATVAQVQAPAERERYPGGRRWWR